MGSFLGLLTCLVAAVGSDLFLRVGMGLLAGLALTAVWTGAFVLRGLRHQERTHEIDLAEAAADLPLQP